MSTPTSPKVRLKTLGHGRGLPLPAYYSKDAAGADLMAALPADCPLMLESGQRALIPCGFAIELPTGFEAQVRPRSGLAYRHGITVLNSPGTIDADYRGEIKVLLINHGPDTFTVTRTMRIAQMVIAPVHRASFIETENFTDTPRGQKGFGSNRKLKDNRPLLPGQEEPAVKHQKGLLVSSLYIAVKPFPSQLPAIVFGEPQPVQPPYGTSIPRIQVAIVR